MKRRQRLRSRRDFAAVFRDSRRSSDRLLTLRARGNALQYSRAGFVCGKIVGNAVARNRIKRQLRELVRTLPVAASLDLVITARPGAAGASYEQLRRSLSGQARRLGILKQEP